MCRFSGLKYVSILKRKLTLNSAGAVQFAKTGWTKLFFLNMYHVPILPKPKFLLSTPNSLLLYLLIVMNMPLCYLSL